MEDLPATSDGVHSKGIEMKQHFTKPGFAEGLPQEIQDILPPAKFFHVGDRLCLLIAQNGIVYWDVEKGENVPLKAGDGASPAWMKEQLRPLLFNYYHKELGEAIDGIG